MTLHLTPRQRPTYRTVTLLYGLGVLTLNAQDYGSGYDCDVRASGYLRTAARQHIVRACADGAAWSRYGPEDGTGLGWTEVGSISRYDAGGRNARVCPHAITRYELRSTCGGGDKETGRSLHRP